MSASAVTYYWKRWWSRQSNLRGHSNAFFSVFKKLDLFGFGFKVLMLTSCGQMTAGSLLKLTVELSWVELGALNTLTTQLNSTENVQNWKKNSLTSWVESSWVGSSESRAPDPTQLELSWVELSLALWTGYEDHIRVFAKRFSKMILRKEILKKNSLQRPASFCHCEKKVGMPLDLTSPI